MNSWRTRKVSSARLRIQDELAQHAGSIVAVSLIRVFAAFLWSAVRLLVRTFISFLPVSNETRESINQLRANVRDNQQAVAGAWGHQQARLRSAIMTQDPRAFLTWDVIAETMSPPPYSRFVRVEKRYLKMHDWPRWSQAITRGSWLNAVNAVHQAYHLCRFETETGLSIADFDLILEFGGGYGQMRRIVAGLGFTGRYMIYDLPDLSALQRFFFATNGIANTVTISDFQVVRPTLEAEPVKSRKLFIAMWSFDESPLEVREDWAGVLACFDAFLIAYQTTFADVDNNTFFERWQTQFPQIAWKTCPIPQLKDSYYLFGVSSSGWP